MYINKTLKKYSLQFISICFFTVVCSNAVNAHSNKHHHKSYSQSQKNSYKHVYNKRHKRFHRKKLDSTKLESYTGLWREAGTGSIYSISNELITVYKASEQTCVVDALLGSIADANTVISKVRGNPYRGRLRLTYTGAKYTSLKLYKIQELPLACLNAHDPSVYDPEFIFEHTWHMFNEYYSFFEVRGVDWQQQYAENRSTITADTTLPELVEVMTGMVAPLKDRHVSLFYGQPGFEGFFSDRGMFGWNQYFLDQSAALGVDPLLVKRQVIETFNQTLIAQHGQFSGVDLMQFEGVNTPIPPIVWTVLDGNVGYLQINSVGFGISEPVGNEFSPEISGLRKINEVMREAMTTLRNTDSLIVDVRFNEGGSLRYSLAIANYFADKKRLAFKVENYNKDHVPRSANKKLLGFVKPKRRGRYTKPISLITSGYTASGAEFFTLAMKTLPHVTQVGENTNGAFSSTISSVASEFPFFRFELSHQSAIDANGTNFEAVGIPPEFQYNVSSVDNLANGIFPGIDFSLNYLQANNDD